MLINSKFPEQPSGIQKGDRVEKQLRSIITGLESTQESGSVDNSHRRQEIMRKNVKRKRNNENESPPMSLSGNCFVCEFTGTLNTFELTVVVLSDIQLQEEETMSNTLCNDKSLFSSLDLHYCSFDRIKTTPY